MKRLIAIGLAFLVFSGCAKTIYNWGSYEDDLYRYYKSSKTQEDRERYMSQLSSLIEKSGVNGRTVPPGIYAEYGYGLYQAGKYEEAILYFEKERSLWPEARPLMERIISNVRTIMAEKEKTSLKNK